MKRIFLFFLLCALLFSACDAIQNPSDTASSAVTESDSVITPITTEEITEEATTAVTEAITETETETEADPNAGRIALPRMVDMTKDEALSLLSENGITPMVTEQESTVAAGTVLRVRFHGTMDGETYYIAPDYPVEIIVSIQKQEQQTSQTVTTQNTQPSVSPDRSYISERATAVNEKTIYLTFDDGPCALTPEVLATLEKYDAKATFFLVGKFVNYRPQVVRDIAAAGHVIACHSYSHDYPAIYASGDGITKEIRDWEAAVEAAIGYIPEEKIFRYPGGSNTSYLAPDKAEEIYNAMHALGYKAYDWTFANNDAYTVNKPEDQPLIDFVKASAVGTLNNLQHYPTRPKIMLMHDTHTESVEMLDWFLNYLTEQGYTFGTLDELDKDWMFY